MENNAAVSRQDKQPRNNIAEWAVTILVMMWASSNLAWAFVVPTASMENTILIGDHIIVDKLAYSPPGPLSRRLLPYTDVKRGDVIVFRFPNNIKEDYVKRVIGLPGDRIKIVAKQLYLNGVPVKEPYKIHKTDFLDSYRDYFPSEPNAFLPASALRMLEQHVENGEVVVPPGHYFAMGDNRDESSDSRYWGFVPRENIIGKPWIIYWSYDAPTADWNWNLRHFVDLGTNFFSKTRWSRTFQTIRNQPVN